MRIRDNTQKLLRLRLKKGGKYDMRRLYKRGEKKKKQEQRAIASMAEETKCRLYTRNEKLARFKLRFTKRLAKRRSIIG